MVINRMEYNKIQQKTNAVLNISQGFGFKGFSSEKSIKKITIEDVRSILNKSLGGKELYDYIRQDRSDR